MRSGRISRSWSAFRATHPSRRTGEIHRSHQTEGGSEKTVFTLLEVSMLLPGLVREVPFPSGAAGQSCPRPLARCTRRNRYRKVFVSVCLAFSQWILRHEFSIDSEFGDTERKAQATGSGGSPPLCPCSQATGRPIDMYDCSLQEEIRAQIAFAGAGEDDHDAFTTVLRTPSHLKRSPNRRPR